jgi:hypothetical protein
MYNTLENKRKNRGGQRLERGEEELMENKRRLKAVLGLTRG